MKITGIQMHRGDRRLIEAGDLSLLPGTVTVLFGGSGCGKSTFLYALADLDPAVLLESEQGPTPLKDMPVGLVPQQSAVFEDMGTVERNLAFAHDHAPDTQPDGLAEVIRHAREKLGLHPEWRFPLSGGQKQRVAIARALAGQAKVLLCDEPTSGLDPASRMEAIRAIRDAARDGMAVLVVTHDLEWNSPDSADQAVVLHRQRLVPHPIGQSLDPTLFQPLAGPQQQSIPAPAIENHLSRVGAAIWWHLLLPLQIGRGLVGGGRVSYRWVLRHFRHFSALVFGLSSLVYMLAGGLLIGFASLYFSAGTLSVQPHMQGILAPELLSGGGWGLHRVIIPLITALLVSAKCGTAVAADIGSRQYGGQIAVMRTLRANPETHLLLTSMLALGIGMPLLNVLAFAGAAIGSLLGFLGQDVGATVYAWKTDFFRLLRPEGGGWMLQGFGWNALKLFLSGLGVGMIAYRFGTQPKTSHTDVGRDISRATLWSSLWCLLVFTGIAFVEFKG